MSNNKSRVFDTGPLSDAEKEYAALKYKWRDDSVAWWEWCGEDNTFSVSPAWEKFTGWDKTVICDHTFSPRVEIEDQINASIRKWLRFVHPEDQVIAKAAAEDFLSTNNQSSSFELGYRLKLADNSYKVVLSTARSIWEVDKTGELRLRSIFCTTRDIEPWVRLLSVSQQTEKHDKKIDLNSLHIKNLEESVAGAKFLAKTIAPVVAILATFAFTVWDEVWESINKRRNPTETIELPAERGVSTFFHSLPDKERLKVRRILSDHGISGGRLILAEYDPGVFPQHFQVLVIAEQENVYLPSISSRRRRTNETPEISIRTENHLTGQLYRNIPQRKESVSFSIDRGFLLQEGRNINQYFFVEAELPKDFNGSLALIQDELAETAAEIQAVLQGSVSDEDSPN